ncbi:MAG: zinc ribbon domain-containing protein [Oscillibacter sp.]|jgi:hypothetical protein|nr:zinc ribbon domain-containing protein [Oscillibacter sp.]
MAYCVNCGVKLNDGAKQCPLCGTEAWHAPTVEPPEPYFPLEPTRVKPESKRALAILFTAMLASVSVCCGLLNLILNAERLWSLYVIGAAVMLWIWFVAPMLLRGIPVFFRLTMDVVAVGIYVYLISVNQNGGHWFRGLALPILGEACVAVFLLSFLLRDHRHSTISTITFCIGGVGLFLMAVGYSLDRYFLGHWKPGWSLVVLVICFGLVIPLQIIRHVPSLWEEAKRRFNM